MLNLNTQIVDVYLKVFVKLNHILKFLTNFLCILFQLQFLHQIDGAAIAEGFDRRAGLGVDLRQGARQQAVAADGLVHGVAVAALQVAVHAGAQLGVAAVEAGRWLAPVLAVAVGQAAAAGDLEDHRAVAVHRIAGLGVQLGAHARLHLVARRDA